MCVGRKIKIVEYLHINIWNLIFITKMLASLTAFIKPIAIFYFGDGKL